MQSLLETFLPFVELRTVISDNNLYAQRPHLGPVVFFQGD